MDGPLWLTRPEDVTTHLIYAAAEIPSAVLSVDGMQVHGSLTAPHESDGTLGFSVDSSLDGLVEPPEAGRSVKVDYEGAEDSFCFITEFQGTDMLKRWLLAVPNTVERAFPRLVARHTVANNPDFGLMIQMDDGRVSVALQDLSSAGCSFGMDKSHRAKPGLLVSGILEVPGVQALQLTMEIRNARPLPGDRKTHLVGARFNDLAHAERTMLARALSAWDLKRRRG